MNVLKLQQDFLKRLLNEDYWNTTTEWEGKIGLTTQYAVYFIPKGQFFLDLMRMCSEKTPTLLNALDGDEEDAWEFRMAFSALEAKSDRLQNELYDYGMPDEQTFDDCTVALIGNRYRAVGYDDYEEDYFSLTTYEENLAETEAGKRLMRLTKKDMISTIGQCFGILMAYYDIRQQYDYLQATFDILRDQNTSLLDTIKEIDKLYASADAEGWNGFSEIEKRFDKLLDTLPDDIWII